jgi:hypothetical protein
LPSPFCEFAIMFFLAKSLLHPLFYWIEHVIR